MIVGAKVIDCSTRGGWGHSPAAHGHWMETYQVLMDRIDTCMGGQPKDGIYVMQMCHAMQVQQIRRGLVPLGV